MATSAHDKIILAMDSANGMWRQTRDAAVSELRLSTNVEQMAGIEKWARAQLAPIQAAKPNVDAMYLGMLERWVLERSGEADSAGRGINAESHADAKKILANPKNAELLDGTPVTDGERITKEDLFLDQMRYRLSRFGLVPDGALKYFSERFKKLRREFPKDPDAIDRLIQKDSFEIRTTSDKEAWRRAMTLTSPRGDKHVPEAPGPDAKVTVRIELDESGGTYALDFMKLEYVSPEGHRREALCDPD